ncbi:phenylacetate--CoA ligase family protein [Williamsia sterculiae]|uniref:Phenylacetate-coenzyme A ligase PaaK, adenylate-forming domain family n=1 Tax=Williamsia sterculiae TaxID=1344003 RepID=A0A1N7GWT7_9NOCA|nr:hypothetical protein [Williamsia sterculiae]SIS17051.1 Phenylacetate-coenzyme A ligase PaaK, adenylate-forming domain family [Williamsia sterculiae]
MVDDLDLGVRWLRRDAGKAVSEGLPGVHVRADRRLRTLLHGAMAGSPFYAELYRGMDPDTVRLADVPRTDKALLMSQFDAWATDRRVTSAAVGEFTRDDSAAGQRFLGDYLLSETSGTSGTTGAFVTEDTAVAVVLALRSRAARVGPRTVLQTVGKRGRTAMVINVRGHHLGRAFFLRENTVGRNSRILSVADPIEQICRDLNEFDPAVLNSYGSALQLLAHEQIAGRLHIEPAIVMPYGETITAAALTMLRTAWPRARVIDRYAANECMFMAIRCAGGLYHLNADWVILEPVDAQGRPTPLGEQSHGVLLTNLFRRVQPVIRYELGDSIRMTGRSCGCGNPLPAFEVSGRTGEIMYFETDGREHGVSPTALQPAIDPAAGITQFQVIRENPRHLSLRLRTDPAADRAVIAETTRQSLADIVTGLGLHDVLVTVSDQLPEQTRGGKYLTVVDRG